MLLTPLCGRASTLTSRVRTMFGKTVHVTWQIQDLLTDWDGDSLTLEDSNGDREIDNSSRLEQTAN